MGLQVCDVAESTLTIRYHPPERCDWIRLAPSSVKEALEAYDQWTDKSQAPPRVKELMLVLCVEVERLVNRG